MHLRVLTIKIVFFYKNSQLIRIVTFSFWVHIKVSDFYDAWKDVLGMEGSFKKLSNWVSLLGKSNAFSSIEYLGSFFSQIWTMIFQHHAQFWSETLIGSRERLKKWWRPSLQQLLAKELTLLITELSWVHCCVFAIHCQKNQERVS